MRYAVDFTEFLSENHLSKIPKFLHCEVKISSKPCGRGAKLAKLMSLYKSWQFVWNQVCIKISWKNLFFNIILVKRNLTSRNVNNIFHPEFLICVTFPKKKPFRLTHIMNSFLMIVVVGKYEYIQYNIPHVICKEEGLIAINYSIFCETNFCTYILKKYLDTKDTM